MKFLRQAGFQKSEHEQDRQTYTCVYTQTDATERITIRGW